MFIFGKPGTGKTHIGERLAKERNFYYYDADDDLPGELKEAAKTGQVTDEMRDRYLERIIARLQKLVQASPGQHIVSTQVLVRERHRRELGEQFPEMRFVLVDCHEHTRRRRITDRPVQPIDPAFAVALGDIFEPVEVPHVSIFNDDDRDVIEELDDLLGSDDS